MKAIKTLIFTFLNILSAVLFFSFNSSAESFMLTAESLSLLEESASMLSYSSCVPYGFIPLMFLNSQSEKSTEDVFCNYLNNQDLYKFDSSSLTINNRPLSYDEIDSITDTFYDGSGNVVDYSNVFYCTVDNGAFSYDLYTTFDGRPIYTDVNKTTPMVNVKLGGNMVSSQEWDVAFSSMANYLENNQYNIALSGTQPTSNAYYCYMGWASGSSRKLAYVYTPNINLPGVCVGNLPANRAVSNIFFNDLSMVSWENVRSDGNTPRMIYFYEGDFRFNGYNYRYKLEMPYVITSDSPTSESVFNDYNGTEKTFNLSATSFDYSDIIANSQAVSFTKVIADDGVIVGNKYNYMDLYDYVGKAQAVGGVTNPYFDPTQAISADNYPIDITLPDFIFDFPLPWPDVIEREPAIDWPLDEPITIPQGNFEIPILNDLSSRFPFSIPWDLRNFIRGFSASRTAPSFQASWYIAPLNYTWNIDIDLSQFNAQAEIFRNCFLILFLIGLARFSYEHFFGS